MCTEVIFGTIAKRRKLDFSSNALPDCAGFLAARASSDHTVPVSSNPTYDISRTKRNDSEPFISK